jgi:hypothetical protein
MMLVVLHWREAISRNLVGEMIFGPNHRLWRISFQEIQIRTNDAV